MSPCSVGKHHDGFLQAYQARGVLRTGTRPTLNRRTKSARRYEHSPWRLVMRARLPAELVALRCPLLCRRVIEKQVSTDVRSSACSQ